jgi:hypothetical protein
MADQVTNYVIAVADKIDAGIEGKLQRISSAATSAGGGCAALQQQIDKLNASGVTSVSQALRSTTDTQRILSTATINYGAAALTAATRSTTFGNSLTRLSANASLAAAQLNGLSTAIGGVTAGSTTISSVANTTANSVGRVGTAATGGALGVRGFTSTVGLMEGRLTSGNRLAGQFLSTFSGFQGIMRAAFAIAGPIALVAVLGEVAQAGYKVVQAYRDMQIASITATNQMILDGQKVVKVKGELFSAQTLARLFNNNDTLVSPDATVQQTAALVKQTTATNEVAAATRRAQEAGLSGASLYVQRKLDIAAEIEDVKKQKDAYDALTQSLRAQSEEKENHYEFKPRTYIDNLKTETKRFVTEGEFDSGNLGNGIEKVDRAKYTDPKQQEEFRKQMTASNEEADKLDTRIKVLGQDLIAAGKKENVASIKDELKAAREEMTRLDSEFKEYVGGLTHKLTPAEGLTWWEHAESGLKHYSDNIDNVQGKEEVYKQQIASRNDKLDNTNVGLDDDITSIGTYNDALKEKQRLDKLTQEFQKTGIPLTDAETAALQRKIAVIVESAEYQKALGTSYEEANGPLDSYTSKTKALFELIGKNPAHTADYLSQLKLATKAYQDAINPLNEYTQSLQREAALMGQYGTELTVSTQLQSIEQTLRAKGKSLTDEQTDALRTQLTVLEQTKQVQADLNSIYNANAGAVEKLNIQQTANNQAYRDGIISADQYRQAALKTAEAQNQLLNDRGLGTFETRMSQIFTSLTANYTTFGAGATKSFEGFFSTLDNGFADAIGHVAAFGGSMKTALLDVARQAVAGLISSLIKLGIEYLIVTTLQKAFNITLPKSDASSGVKQTAANTVAAIAAITAVSAAEYTAIDLLTKPAWDLAEAVSLFSFGANAAGAEAGIAAVIAAGQSAQKFAVGGPVRGPGSSVSDSIPARLSNGEYVVNAHATSQNYALLDAINNGGKMMHYAAGGYVSGTQVQQASGQMMGGGVNVNIVHDGSTAIEVRQGPTAQDMQVIAKNAVYQHADDAIAGAVGNGNSKTRQSLQQNTTASPRRG